MPQAPALLACAALLAASCADDGGGPPAAVTSSASSIDIGPYPQATALAGVTGTETFILDLASGDIFVFKGAWPGLRWVDDRTLATDLGTRVDLDERRHIIGEFDDPAALPVGRAFTSPDGEWRLEVSRAQTAVVATDGSRRIAITGATNQPANTDGADPQPEFAWSPAGRLLAFGGGRCADSPLQLVDPVTGRIVVLNAPGTRVEEYAWRPDGAALAFSTQDAEGLAGITLHDTASGGQTPLIPDEGVGLRGELMGLAWNPAGSRLLFTVNTPSPCPS